MLNPNQPMVPTPPVPPNLTGMINKELKGKPHPLLELAKGTSPAVQLLVRAKVKAEKKQEEYKPGKKKK